MEVECFREVQPLLRDLLVLLTTFWVRASPLPLATRVTLTISRHLSTYVRCDAAECRVGSP